VEWFFVLMATAYNLIRIPKILAATSVLGQGFLCFGPVLFSAEPREVAKPI
jgi:hypothetical protein